MGRQFFDWKEYVLDNGLKIITIKKDTELCSIHLGVDIGPVNEEENEKGLCHFIEHMLFKGTKSRTNIDIDQDLENRAGSYNAYTTYTSTVFSITALFNELEASMEILSDIIVNSTFPSEEIDKERGVILAEFRNGYDDVEQYSFSQVNKAGFEKSPLKYDILGKESLVKSFTRDEIIAFYNRYYIPNNSAISIVSSLEHEEVFEKTREFFEKWESKELKKKEIIVEKNRNVELVSYKKEIEQNTIVYLYTFYNLTRDEELALDILNHKLGESPNSILFRALREERGIAYDIYSEIDITDYIKTLYIYSSTSEEDIFEAKKTIDYCIESIVNKHALINESNISLMKKVMKTGIASILEDSEGLGNYVLHQRLMNKRIDAFVEDLEALNNIKAEDVYEVAKKVLINPTIHMLLSQK
ncbi:Predicted Zn-dependent peptidase [Proteiniborus ethanoligenes]|uniref:Predicted Zn-dependent peptidase n=1 Tax=Proteiniborus ethanoligenes TaxID=415015 RepID=A0A1H3LF52_9FIRM|nr:pitrilysin family protein [Proteiniborus ethanoligenes]SDY62946.1 Predicted Zn-dependent peptidase [Proteiniborus ethanoligenes]